MKSILIVFVVLLSCSISDDTYERDLILELDSIEKVDIVKKIFIDSIFEKHSLNMEKIVLKNSLVLYNDSLYLSPDILKTVYSSQFSNKQIETPTISKIKNGYYIDILGNWTLGIKPPEKLRFVSHHFEIVKNKNLSYDFLFVKEPINKNKIIINLGRVSNERPSCSVRQAFRMSFKK